MLVVMITRPGGPWHRAPSAASATPRHACPSAVWGPHPGGSECGGQARRGEVGSEMCEAGEAMVATAGDEAEDDISVGSGSPRPLSRPDTDDSMVDVEDSGGEGGADDAGPKVEPPDPAMSPGPGGPRTPPAAHQPNNQQHHRTLKFSIDNILKPDFGRRAGEASEQPVDLSRVTPRGAKEAGRGLGGLGLPPLHHPPAAPMKERDATPGATLWPAWVYCTRYSDRPSAGGHTLITLPYTPSLSLPLALTFCSSSYHFLLYPSNSSSHSSHLIVFLLSCRRPLPSASCSP